MQTRDETRYRIKLAEEHLKKAKEEISLYQTDREKHHLAACVASSQICVENSAKAVISSSGIPSKTHDPSAELSNVIKHIRGKLRKGLVEKLEKVVEYSHLTAPEHILATYGDEERALLPSELYTLEDAERFLRMAEFSWKTCDEFLKAWFGKD